MKTTEKTDDRTICKLAAEGHASAHAAKSGTAPSSSRPRDGSRATNLLPVDPLQIEAERLLSAAVARIRGRQA